MIYTIEYKYVFEFAALYCLARLVYWRRSERAADNFRPPRGLAAPPVKYARCGYTNVTCPQVRKHPPHPKKKIKRQITTNK